MRIVRIRKWFQGGMGTYYAIMPKGKKVRSGCWEYQLREWGDNTSGGHNYGYHIQSGTVTKVPKVNRWKCGVKLRAKKNAPRLRFNANYIERKKG